ncbi:hypothetical protein QJQ59_05935 (plasmid) [Klebsiella michiganensis]|nr:hypothetical protein QJQ59_01190 [Klebsiella michiganensis]WGZ97659.1 hypothetical protein QJQ59_05935 [Klebsiella michiganensis]
MTNGLVVFPLLVFNSYSKRRFHQLQKAVVPLVPERLKVIWQF